MAVLTRFTATKGAGPGTPHVAQQAIANPNLYTQGIEAEMQASQSAFAQMDQAFNTLKETQAKQDSMNASLAAIDMQTKANKILADSKAGIDTTKALAEYDQWAAQTGGTIHSEDSRNGLGLKFAGLRASLGDQLVLNKTQAQQKEFLTSATASAKDYANLVSGNTGSYQAIKANLDKFAGDLSTYGYSEDQVNAVKEQADKSLNDSIVAAKIKTPKDSIMQYSSNPGEFPPEVEKDIIIQSVRELKVQRTEVAAKLSDQTMELVNSGRPADPEVYRQALMLGLYSDLSQALTTQSVHDILKDVKLSNKEEVMLQSFAELSAIKDLGKQDNRTFEISGSIRNEKMPEILQGELNKDAPGERQLIAVDSPGGLVHIKDDAESRLRAYGGGTYDAYISSASSAAAQITLTADRIYAEPGAQIMLHGAMSGPQRLTLSDLTRFISDLENNTPSVFYQAELEALEPGSKELSLERLKEKYTEISDINEKAVNTIAARHNKTPEWVRENLYNNFEKDGVFTAKQLKDMGLDINLGKPDMKTYTQLPLGVLINKRQGK